MPEEGFSALRNQYLREPLTKEVKRARGYYPVLLAYMQYQDGIDAGTTARILGCGKSYVYHLRKKADRIKHHWIGRISRGEIPQ